MRGRALFIGFVILNVAFAAALIAFVARSGGKSSPPLPNTLGSVSNIPNIPAALSSTPTVVGSSNKPTSTGTTAPPAVVVSSVPTNPPPLEPSFQPAPEGKYFGWQDVETTAYLGYLKNLRAVGCPENRVRQIIFYDANELFNQRRLQAAITNDFKWWQTDNQLATGGYNPEFQSRMQNLVQERRELLTRMLGANWEEEDKTPSLANHTIALTGPVLGGLNPELYLGVQEICARSVSRHQDYLMGRFNEGQASSQVELAKLRDQTRKELSTILDRDQLEEFLLRFSHNSSRLRQDLRGLGLTPDEFRKVFRATDQIDHQIQLEYGGDEALSPKQREGITRQREQAMAAVLGQDRYARLVLSRDPVYRQAQAAVLNTGAPDSSIPVLYDLLRTSQLKRQQILADSNLTADQKQDALTAVNQDFLKQQRKILADR